MQKQLKCSLDQYHANPGYGSSALRHAIVSLARYRAHRDLPVKTESMELSQAFRAYLRGPSHFERNFVVGERPASHTHVAKVCALIMNREKFKTTSATRGTKAWKIAAADADDTPLFHDNDVIKAKATLRHVGDRQWIKPSAAQQAVIMAQSLRTNPHLVDLFNDPETVYDTAYFAKDYATGLTIKCRPDAVCRGVVGSWRMMADLTPAIGGVDNVKDLKLVRAIDKYGYHVSAALTLDITGSNSYLIGFVEKRAPYEIAPVALSESKIETGRELYKTALHRIAKAQQSGDYPALFEELLVV